MRHVLGDLRSARRSTDRHRQGKAPGHRRPDLRHDGRQTTRYGGLSKEMQDYVKTVNVILGKSLYSDSWLEASHD
jgi:hypothetical protein